MAEQRKTIRVKIPLKLLTDAWDTRSNPDQDLDSRLTELVVKGLESKGFKICPHCKSDVLKTHIAILKGGFMESSEMYKYQVCPTCGYDNRPPKEQRPF